MTGQYSKEATRPIPISEPPTAMPAIHREREQAGGCWVASLVLLLVSLLLSVSLGFLAMFELRYQDRIYPGVRVDPLDLSGMTRSEATRRLTELLGHTYPWWPTLRHGDKIWTPTQEELGVTIDIEETVARAYAIGRSHDLWQAFQEQLESLRYGRTIQPVIRFDRAQARRYLSALAHEVNVPVREASLRVEGTRVEFTPSQQGYELDEAATLDLIEKKVMAWQGGEVQLVVHEIQPVISDVSDLKERIERIISQPIELVGPADIPKNQWTLTPEDLAGMLILQQRMEKDGQVVGSVSLSEAALRTSVENIAKEVNRPPIEGQVDWDLRLGKLIVVKPSQTGYQLDVDKTVSLIQTHALSQNRQIVLPVEELAPQIDTNNLPALGIVEQIVKATTSFKGSSQARMKNIELAAARFDGILLAPNEIFSFNKYLGEVSEAQGYTPSLVIWGDRTAVGIGGGICQVSTTAFRAAFWAGLEILERWAHGYRVSWYEPPVGMDATVYSPAIDFKFRNDTPYYLLIKTQTDLEAGTLTFYFFSTKTGRVVEMEGPVETNVVPHGPPEYQEDPSLPAGTVKQVDWAHDGVDVTVKRIVREGNKIVHEDVFFSRYQPWRAVFLVGTGKSSEGETKSP